jgi:hypothetical protein
MARIELLNKTWMLLMLTASLLLCSCRTETLEIRQFATKTRLIYQYGKRDWIFAIGFDWQFIPSEN